MLTLYGEPPTWRRFSKFSCIWVQFCSFRRSGSEQVSHLRTTWLVELAPSCSDLPGHSIRFDFSSCHLHFYYRILTIFEPFRGAFEYGTRLNFAYNDHSYHQLYQDHHYWETVLQDYFASPTIFDTFFVRGSVMMPRMSEKNAFIRITLNSVCSFVRFWSSPRAMENWVSLNLEFPCACRIPETKWATDQCFMGKCGREMTKSPSIIDISGTCLWTIWGFEYALFQRLIALSWFIPAFRECARMWLGP